MNELNFMGCIASVLQFIVAIYALRLNRRYGTARVGWSLFCAFSLLALLQLTQLTAPLGAGANAALEINATYALISFLLLTGMIHLETMLKERLRMERVEKQLRADLESEVKSKTAHLTRAIDELMSEIEERKRMAAIIKTSELTIA
jgi:C4-dicarboxylate-specific signal transduction histidine kinase